MLNLDSWRKYDSSLILNAKQTKVLLRGHTKAPIAVR